MDMFEAYHRGRAHAACVALEVLFKHMKGSDPETFEKVKSETLAVIAARLPAEIATPKNQGEKAAEMLRDATMKVANGLFED